jgi:hypothetical protein
MAASFSGGWNCCSRCLTLFFGGPAPGACPAGGVHDHTGSWDLFMLHVDGDIAGPNQQPAWRMCEKCRVLFYGLNAASSSCAAGGQHHASAPWFAVQVDDGSSPTNQQGWRWCKNCQALVWAMNPSPGPCPAGAGSVHDSSTSAHYDLPFFGVPWIGTYEFEGRLRAQGSNYTLGGQVDVITTYIDGRLFHSERVTAIENQSAPGGWITADTGTLSGSRPPSAYSACVQAHDLASNKWSPRLPIALSFTL